MTSFLEYSLSPKTFHAISQNEYSVPGSRLVTIKDDAFVGKTSTVLAPVSDPFALYNIRKNWGEPPLKPGLQLRRTRSDVIF